MTCLSQKPAVSIGVSTVQQASWPPFHGEAVDGSSRIPQLRYSQYQHRHLPSGGHDALCCPELFEVLVINACHATLLVAKEDLLEPRFEGSP